MALLTIRRSHKTVYICLDEVRHMVLMMVGCLSTGLDRDRGAVMSYRIVEICLYKVRAEHER